MRAVLYNYFWGVLLMCDRIGQHQCYGRYGNSVKANKTPVRQNGPC